MEGGDVRVADEWFRIPAKYIPVEIWNDSDGAIATRCRNHRFDVGIAPHLHQVFRALLILAMVEAPLALHLGLEQDVEAGFLHRLDAALQPGAMRRVGRSYDTYGVAFLEGCGSRQARLP